MQPSTLPKILLLNGPNLNLLGKREPEIYGKKGLDDVVYELEAKNVAQIFHLQSNHEGILVDRIHEAANEKIDFILINPGAFTHTSIALRDALLGVNIPFIEIHLSNVHARESFRHHSYFSDISDGIIVGLGTKGYSLALEAAIDKLTNTKPIN